MYSLYSNVLSGTMVDHRCTVTTISGRQQMVFNNIAGNRALQYRFLHSSEQKIVVILSTNKGMNALTVLFY